MRSEAKGAFLLAALVAVGLGRVARPAGGGPVPSAAGEAMGLVEITNGTIVLGVVPALGGRVAVVRTANGENLLDFEARRAQPPFPEPALETPFEPWNGRIVWAGPQSGFWSQQELRPELRLAHAGWPPDPFNETRRFEIVERTPTRLRLKGAPSPVTGLALEHDYEIVGPRSVRLKTTATNGRATAVSWDLWPNTRVRPEGFPYVPVDPRHAPRLDGPHAGQAEAGACASELADGWLSLPPGQQPQAPQQRLWTKAFIRPRRGLIAYFHGHELLLIAAPLVPQERIHPEQTFTELYRGAGPGSTILELEMHGAYETIAPGASTSFEQTLEIQDYDGPADAVAHRRRLALLVD